MRKHPAIVAALAAVGIGTKTTPVGKPEATPDSSEPDIVTVEIPETEDPKVFLTALMNCSKAGVKARLEAAKALLPFEHAKMGEKGKKEKLTDAAKGASAGGRFALAAPPKLVVSNKNA